MDKRDIEKTAKGKGALAKEIASRNTDPHFYGALNVLPNPDPVLRKLGKTQDVYDAIVSDAHVIGELRSIRAGMLGYEWRLQAGGDSPSDQRALELCNQVMSHRPAPGMQWPDVIWNMAHSVFRGFVVHEVVWQRQDRFLVPAKVVDRPQRRFTFSADNELRLRMKGKPADGIELGNYKWLLTRHMPSYTNPYGVALFSSCFWPYTFKHSGFRYFTKFCEKYGLPWAVGKYPQGTPEKEQKALVDALMKMVEDAVAAVPDNGAVELITTGAGMAATPQERLIKACNKEMSKALTSQTLATEIQGQGSRAASETHRGREQDVNESDRQIICSTFNELLLWITELNIAGAKPPTFEFFEEAEARQEWVDVLDVARGFMDVPRQFAHERLQIPLPKDGDDVLPRDGAAVAGATSRGPEFSSCPHCGKNHDFSRGDDEAVTRLSRQAADGADEIIDTMIEPVRALLDQVDTLAEFRAGLVVLYPMMDEQRLGEYTSLALMTGLLSGMDEAR